MLTYHSFTMANIKFIMIFFVIVLEFMFISICRKYLLFKFSAKDMWYIVKNVVVTLFFDVIKIFQSVFILLAKYVV